MERFYQEARDLKGKNDSKIRKGVKNQRKKEEEIETSKEMIITRSIVPNIHFIAYDEFIVVVLRFASIHSDRMEHYCKINNTLTINQTVSVCHIGGITIHLLPCAFHRHH